MKRLIRFTWWLVNLVDHLLLWRFPRRRVYTVAPIRWLFGSVKWLLHLISGKSELHRLLEEASAKRYGMKTSNRASLNWIIITPLSSCQLCNLVVDIICTSKSLVPVQERLNSIKADTSIEEISNQLLRLILKLKRIPSRSSLLRDRLGNYLIHICTKLVLIEKVKVERATAFDQGNKAHLSLLQDLWTNLKGVNTPMPPIPDEKWKELGFQGTNPASDFRSVGLLGLRQLAYFANSTKQRHYQIYQQAQYGPYWYSFAIVALNATHAVCTYLKNGQLDGLLFTLPFLNQNYDEAAREILDCTFMELLREFHREWMKAKPNNLMAFNEIFAQAMKQIELALHQVVIIT